ncbi:MAG: DUF58 domain-containing protein [Verrucomicrobia bacterium]|nr:DUF58 domain-containing protein [Verrucomicrobiota bacterium]
MFKRLIYRNYRAYTGITFRFGRRVTPAGWLVLIGLMLAAALGLDTTQTLAYQAFTFLFFCVVMAVFASFFARPKLSFERILPKFGTAGEPLRYQVLVKNPRGRSQRALSLIEDLPDPRPSFEEFVSTPEPGEEKRNWYDRSQGWYRWEYLVSQNSKAAATEVVLPTIPAKGNLEVPLELLPSKRGFLRLQGMVVLTPDPFGIFRTIRKFALPETVMILPKRYAIPRVELPGITKYQQGGVSMASSIGESEEFVALRDYRSGDPLRHIHWKSFAKLGKPVVKEFQDEFFVRHALVLDTFDVPLHSELFEEAVSVAASFSYTIHTQDTLLDLMFVGPQAYCFTTGRGVGQTEQMLEILAAVQPCREKEFSSLKQIVLEHLDAVSGVICILLSWDNERQNFIEQLKVMGVPVLVFVVTEEDAELAPGPMADKPENFRPLPLGKIGEELAKL